MCDPLLWSYIRPELEKQFEFIHLAIPVVDDFESVLSGLQAQLPDEPVNLLGFSLGGYLATCLAELRPDSFKRLLIVSNSPCKLPDAELSQRLQTIKWLSQFPYSGITDKKIEQMLALEHKGSVAIKSIIKTMEQNLGYDCLLKQLTATSERQDKSAEIVSSKIDWHFCFGDEDNLVNFDWMEQIAKQGINTYQVAKCGHMLPLEQPQALVALVNNVFSQGNVSPD